MGNSSSINNNLFVHCNIYPDPPDLRDKYIDLTEYEKFLEEAKENNITENQSNNIDSSKNNFSDNSETMAEITTLNNYSQFRKLIDLRANIDVLPIYNLSIENVGMTAVNAIGAIVYSQIFSRGGSLFCPSRCFIMYNTLWKDNYFNEISDYNIKHNKLCLRDYLKSLKRFGICDEKNYNYQYESLLTKPSEICYYEGKYLNFDYYRIPNEINTIKYFLSQNKMILCNLSIYNSFLENETKRSGRINLPQEMDSYLGMLACCIVGYIESNQTFILRFSFGSYWGDKGYGSIKYEYGLKLINDLWIISIEIPFVGNLKDIIQKKKLNNNFDVNNFSLNSLNNYHLESILENQNKREPNINNRKYRVGGFSVL